MKSSWRSYGEIEVTSYLSILKGDRHLEQRSEKEIYSMKLGIIGTGRIANRFVPETKYVEEIEPVSVYNPHEESAVYFADKWGLKSYFGRESLSGFFDDIDAVYIATPHRTHCEYIRMALEKGKHVLCEKPLTLVDKEAAELFKLASDKSLILMEAIKTAYCPGYKKLLETARSGIIGEVLYIESCFTKLEKPDSRELTDKVTGGSFTELGTYVMLPILSLFGTEAEYDFQRILREDGLDIFTKCNVLYENGKLATATCGLGVKSEGRLVISGTNGYILVSAPWWKTSRFEVHFEDASDVRYFEEPFEGDGLRYELKEFYELVKTTEAAVSSGTSEDETINESGDDLNAIDIRTLKHSFSEENSLQMARLMKEFLSTRSKTTG